MTFEELLKKFGVEKPEAITELKDAIRGMIDSELAGLRKNRDDLHDEKKKLSDQLSKYADVDPEEYHKFKDGKSKEEREKAYKAGDFEKLETELKKKHETEIIKLNEQLAASQARFKKYYIETSLNETMLNLKIAPHYAPAVRALVSSKVDVAIDGETMKALIGDKELKTYLTEWVQTDEGKHYVSAPATSGGGAPGNIASAGGKNGSVLPAMERLKQGHNKKGA